MAKLLMIADDFTGALDSGVKFAECGAVVRIVADIEYDFETMDSKIQVLVMNAETRHMDAKAAYHCVYHMVTRAKKAGISYIYKKTDSALRGNVGSELTAMLEACSSHVLHFLPAFPKMGRTTKNGIQYIDGVPVGESVFMKDPFDPVTCSEIAKLIEIQSSVAVQVVTNGQIVREADIPVIAVYDAETDEELCDLARKLSETNQLGVIAGCAGLAEALPGLLRLSGPMLETKYTSTKFMVACGSVNPITRKQLDYAENHGFHRIQLTPWQKLEPGYFQTSSGKIKIRELTDAIQNTTLCILDTNDEKGRHDTIIYAKEHGYSMEEIRIRIADTLGYLLNELIKNGIKSTMMITGGDTLLGFMKQIQVYEMIPIREIAPGTVLSRFEIDGTSFEVISKSGGFGKESLIVDLAKHMAGYDLGKKTQEEEICCS